MLEKQASPASPDQKNDGIDCPVMVSGVTLRWGQASPKRHQRHPKRHPSVTKRHPSVTKRHPSVTKNPYFAMVGDAVTLVTLLFASL
jgi:hypothetical protein